MKISSNIRKSAVFIYTIMFIIIFSLFYLMFIKYNKSLIWNEDGIRQHYSILYNFNETNYSYKFVGAASNYQNKDFGFQLFQ